MGRPSGSARLALVRLVLGLLLGLSGLIAMARLVAGAFAGGTHLIVWLVTGVVMFGWVAYAGSASGLFGSAPAGRCWPWSVH